MNTLDARVAWIREVRRRAHWTGFIVGMSVATILFSVFG